MDDSSLCGTSSSERESTDSVSCGKFPVEKCYIGEDKDDEDDFSEEALLSQMGYTKSEPKRSDEEGEEEEEEDNEDEDDLSEETLLFQMGYTKSEPKRSGEEGDEEEEEEGDLSEESFLAQMGCLKNEPPKHEPIMAPAACLNLVSAFKGSREKEGKPHKEFRVSWSPEVYDPPCTSDDHFTQSKNERHRSDQKAKGVAGKNRQKSAGKGVAIEVVGKGSKGGGSKASSGGGKAPGKSKDKKQAAKKTKKHGGKKAGKYSAPGED